MNIPESEIASKREAAILYAKRGWKVFPVHAVNINGKCSCGKHNCKQVGKHPRTQHGCKDATSELDIVLKWWSETHAGANIGLLCDGDFWALDVDPRHEGDVTLNQLEKKHGALPKTVTNRTGGGGSHYLFKKPGDIEVVNRSNTSGELSGLDSRSSGGYIIVPPSKHRSGSEYQWDVGRCPDEMEIAAAPNWLIERFSKRKQKSKVSQHSVGHEKLTDDQVADMLDCIDPSIANDEWIKVGMALHSGGYDFSVWHHWSSRGENYEGEDECISRWNSFGSGAVTMGTLIYMAKEAGYSGLIQTPKFTFEDCISKTTKLTAESQPEDINGVLKMASEANLNAVENRQLLSKIKNSANIPLGDLRKGLVEIKKKASGPAEDLAYVVAEKTLKRFYAGGNHLVRGIDKGFWKYNGKHWERQTDEQVQNRVLEIIKTHVDPDDASFAGTLRAALSLIISKQAADDDVLKLAEEPPSVINCQNGELWIDLNGNVELRPHRFTSYLTYVLDVAYDPTAKSPRFDQALIDIFSNSSDPTDMARHFQEFMGYAIQPKRDIAAFFMLRGKGRNGKTKLMETLERLINKRAIYSDRLASIEKNKFAIGALAGKLLLVDDDVDTGTKLPDGFLKKVSERKLMTGELKFKDSFEFICTALPVLLANNYPYAADLSWGMRRRAHIIPFERVFTEEDADDSLFPFIWQNELPGILNRAIEGLNRLRQRGNFSQPTTCKAAHDIWLAQANPLSSFINEECQVSTTGYTLLKNFYFQFKFWAEGAGIRNIASRNTIKSNLENLGYEVRRRGDGNAVFGLVVDGG
ncbi:MAG: bifunctional DNA primase/polymerase [Rhodospirillales bacterium]|nr:bifunctional DNA primase/polymerase [Rhodospirillales bacterium]